MNKCEACPHEEEPDDVTTIRWFGPWIGAPICNLAPEVPTPVGAPCALCERPIVAGDKGITLPLVGEPGMPQRLVYHRGCFLRTVVSPENFTS